MHDVANLAFLYGTYVKKPNKISFYHRFLWAIFKIICFFIPQ